MENLKNYLKDLKIPFVQITGAVLIDVNDFNNDLELFVENNDLVAAKNDSISVLITGCKKIDLTKIEGPVFYDHIYKNIAMEFLMGSTYSELMDLVRSKFKITGLQGFEIWQEYMKKEEILLTSKN